MFCLVFYVHYRYGDFNFLDSNLRCMIFLVCVLLQPIYNQLEFQKQPTETTQSCYSFFLFIFD